MAHYVQCEGPLGRAHMQTVQHNCGRWQICAHKYCLSQCPSGNTLVDITIADCNHCPICESCDIKRGSDRNLHPDSDHDDIPYSAEHTILDLNYHAIANSISQCHSDHNTHGNRNCHVHMIPHPKCGIMGFTRQKEPSTTA